MDALKDGQMAFFVAIDDIATSVHTNVRSFEEDRERFVRALREAAAAHTATGSPIGSVASIDPEQPRAAAVASSAAGRG